MRGGLKEARGQRELARVELPLTQCQKVREGKPSRLPFCLKNQTLELPGVTVFSLHTRTPAPAGQSRSLTPHSLPESRCKVRLRGLNKLGCRLESRTLDSVPASPSGRNPELRFALCSKLVWGAKPA